MKDILYRYEKVAQDLAEITEKTNRAVAEYSASFSCDHFGQCKMPSKKVKEDLEAFTEELTKYSSMIENEMEKLIMLVGEVENKIAEFLDKRDKAKTDEAGKLLDDIHHTEAVILAVLENCFGEFSAKLRAFLNLPGEIITVNVGLIRSETSVFTVRLKSYTEKITRLDR